MLKAINTFDKRPASRSLRNFPSNARRTVSASFSGTAKHTECSLLAYKTKAALSDRKSPLPLFCIPPAASQHQTLHTKLFRASICTPDKRKMLPVISSPHSHLHLSQRQKYHLLFRELLPCLFCNITILHFGTRISTVAKENCF